MVKYLLAIGFTVLLVVPRSSHAQTSQIDSLLKKLANINANADKARILIQLAAIYQKRSTPRSVDFAQKALKLSEKLNYQKGIGEAMYYMAIGQFNLSKYTAAQDYLTKASVLYKGIDYKKGVANAQKQIGKIYDRLGDYEKALEHYVNSLRINEDINNKQGMAASYLEIGRVYFHRKDYYKSLEYSREALTIALDIEDDDLLGEGYKNLATTYQEIPQFKQALTYYNRALKIFERLEDQNNKATTLLGLSDLYLSVQQPNQALEYLLKARAIQQKAEDLAGLGYTSLGIGKVYTQANNFKRALDYLEKSLKVFLKIKSKKPISEAYLALSQAYEQKGNHEQAHRHFQLYKAYTDSLFNERQSLQIIEMETRLNLRTKEVEIKRLNKEQEVKDEAIRLHKADLKKQRTLLAILLASSGLILGLAFVLFNSRLKLRRGNRQLTQQNKEIQRQKKIVEGQHRKITDGLRYAETIQLSILPKSPRIGEFFREHFVIYKAKDLVSGDFYWLEKIQGKTVIAVVDCTGHGVSGAFMSMIGNTLLNEIVRHKQILSPETILEELHQGVVEALRKKESDLDLGMEACICVIEPLEEQKQKLIFAGAKRPLYYIHQEQITEVRGNRNAVGFDFGKKRIFENRILEVEKGGVLYLTTDGYIDQAGENNQRLGSGRFKNLLVAYAKLSLTEQKEKLEKALQKHQKNLPQRDDITILAVRL